MQLNYGALAQDAAVHRSTAQRLVMEMLQRTAMHIVSGHNIRVCWLIASQAACWARQQCPVCQLQLGAAEPPQAWPHGRRPFTPARQPSPLLLLCTPTIA